MNSVLQFWSSSLMCNGVKLSVVPASPPEYIFVHDLSRRESEGIYNLTGQIYSAFCSEETLKGKT